MVMSETDASFLRLLRDGCGVLIPAWVYGEAALPRSRKEKQRLSAKYRNRKIRQHSLEFENHPRSAGIRRFLGQHAHTLCEGALWRRCAIASKGRSTG